MEIERPPAPAIQNLVRIADSLEATRDIDQELTVLHRLYALTDSLGPPSAHADGSGRLGRHFLYSRGKINQAHTYLITQRDLLESAKMVDTVELIRCYIDLSFLHTKKLEPDFALSYAELARKFLPITGAADSNLCSEVYYALAYSRYYLTDYALAVADYRTARAYLSKQTPAPALQNKILLGMGNAFYNGELPDSSTIYFDLYHQSNTHDTLALADYHRSRGASFYIQEDYQHSITELKKAIDLYRRETLSNPYSLVDAFFILSASYQYSHEFSSAFAMIDSALARQFKSEELSELGTDISSIALLSARAEIMADKAISERDTHLAQQSLKLYTRVDTLRKSFIKLDIDAYLHQQYYDNYYYWKHVELYTFFYEVTGSAHWLNRMHAIITEYKAQGLNRDKVLNELYHSPVGNTASFQSYVDNDLALEAAIQVGDHHTVNRLLRQRPLILSAMSKEIPEALESILYAKDIPAEQLLAYTHENDCAVLNFYIGNPYYNRNRIYALLAVDGQFKLHVIDDSEDLLGWIDTYYLMNKTATAYPDSIDVQEYYSISKKIYDRLFDGLWDRMSGVSQAVIIPDERLHGLSFEGLVTEPVTINASGSHTADIHYLVEDLNIVYAYSPNDLAEHKTKDASQYLQKILAMGFSSEETIRKSPTRLNELNSSYRELAVIRKLIGDDKALYFSGYDCTKAHFLEHAHRAEIIHLSTHGAYNPESRTSGMLYFHNKEALDSLCQHEIRYRDIRPRLLVLSACDSGAGKLSNEEGMFSIGRTFQAFGADEAVTALWPISNNASADFFQHFYTALFNSQDAQGALRRTKLEMCKENSRYQLPAFWSSLVLHL